ncbi:MAG: PAS domain-containing protein [Spirochaetales bacterium]|nr:PAS domain-containing protein [Spirochaetales bacterium]
MSNMDVRNLQSMQEFDAVLNAMTEPAIIYDMNGIAIKVNDAAVTALGFNPGGLTNLEITEKLALHRKNTDLKESGDLISNRALRGEVIEKFNYPFRTADGEEKVSSCSASPVRIGGSVIGALFVWHDITHQKKNESMYENERKRFLNILDSFQDGVFICNKDHEIEYANPAIKTSLGDPGDRKCFEYIHNRNTECPWCRKPEVFEGKTIKSEWQDPGSGRTYDLVDTPIHNPDGSLSKLKVLHDITDSKEREKILNSDKIDLIDKVVKINYELKDKKSQLKQQAAIIEKLFENTHFLIAVLNTDFEFIRVNRAYALADGQAEDYFIGKNHFDLYPHEENEVIFRKVVETGESHVAYAKPFTYLDKPERGTSYWDWSLNPIKDETGKVTGLILILFDVTLRKKAEFELAEAKRLSDIGALASTVAHELRSPLGVILGTVYNVMRKHKDEKLMQNMRRIERKISESEKIINNLLNYARLKQPELKKIHLYNFLDECIDDTIKQHLNSKVKINKNYSVFKNTTLKIDPFQMREVITNILNNAYQAFTDDTGTVNINGSKETSLINLEIQDNGLGINEADLKKIFEPFFTSKSKGTGLGLTICKELVNLHKGGITIESEKGKGTTVHISLPLEN